MASMERRECQGLREGDNERKEEQKKKMRIRGRNGTGRQRKRGWRESPLQSEREKPMM